MAQWSYDVIMSTFLGIGAELAAPENRQDGHRLIIAGSDSANQVEQDDPAQPQYSVHVDELPESAGEHPCCQGSAAVTLLMFVQTPLRSLLYPWLRFRSDMKSIQTLENHPSLT